MLAAFASAILLFWLAIAWEVMRGNRRLTQLATVRPPEPASWPRVSIVIAARNEAPHVDAAVRTLLALDYPDFEIIAVDDRSEDDTGAILDRLSDDDPRLRVVHVRELPTGWIGKNNALHLGAARATGDWILFTDADVHFSPDAVRRAVAHACARALAHLTAVPRLSSKGHLLGVCVNAFGVAFTVGLRPWRIPDPRSRTHGGVGAFNLVRAATYRRLGGHEPIRLRPDDDIKLAKLMKSGGTSEFLLGVRALSVEWYHSTGDMVRGMTKNSYAGADYRWWVPSAGAFATVMLYVIPVAALAFADGVAGVLLAAAVGVMLAVGCDQTRFTGGRWWYGLLLPVGMVVFSYILLRSQFVTHATGGITWRGTHYPLDQLRANKL